MRSSSFVSIILQKDRPRDVGSLQAAAILYGDWGTSKAYVIGLAFALAGYSSFWLVLAVSILCVLVGLNYTTICKYYPKGGGVYSSVRERSPVLALVAAFFLIADYIVTASLSALSAFSYLGVPNPAIWASAAILIIGLLNYLGPRHTGNLAFFVAVPTVIIVVLLGIFSFFHLGEAIQGVQPLEGSFLTNWDKFVGVIVALSGIEAIANTTGVMKLNPESSVAKPLVTRTSTPAILMVMFEVCFFTTLFALAAAALPGLVISGEDVNAPDYPNVRDSMLRYMGQVFASNTFGPQIGMAFGWIISLVFFVLLLSAVNTAIVGLVGLIYVLSSDGELPELFRKTNAYGVPKAPLLFAALGPVVVLAFVNDIVGLANLYAIGFVGAIATNLGATSTSLKLEMRIPERMMMFCTFLIMAAIEITLFIEKDHARNYVIAIVAIGLILRSLVKEVKHKQEAPGLSNFPITYNIVSDLAKEHLEQEAKTESEGYTKTFTKITPKEKTERLHIGTMLCAVTHPGRTLDFAIEECRMHQQHLYVLYIREQRVITEKDKTEGWKHDEQAMAIVNYVGKTLDPSDFTFIYTISDSPALSIITAAQELHVSRVILGQSRRHPLLHMIQTDNIKKIVDLLPPNIDVVIIS